MSHFTVLVIGSNIEQQLHPFHEFECTGISDEFVVDVDITEEVQSDIEEQGSLEKGLEWAYCLSNKVVSDENQVDRDGAHKFGYAVVRDGKLIKAVNRTNPNEKWDWYQVGGRWSGFFLLKDGSRADQALFKDIDIKGMRQEAENKATERYNNAHRVMGPTAVPDSWETVQARHTDADGKVDYG